MTNPVWSWAVEHSLTSWDLTRVFDGPPSDEAGPCWSFSRYGRTETVLPDGRVIRVGGEYEDWYDPDFCIYNDVIVTDPGGNTEIFGYPDGVFPPTDFHTATLVEDRIVLIGNTSYPEYRKENAQVLLLDTENYRIEPINAEGESPKWLWGHSAKLIEDGKALLIHGGEVSDDRFPVSIDNIDDWRFDLEDLKWDRLTRRTWPRFIFMRDDRDKHRLFWLRSLQRDLTAPSRMGQSRDRANFLRLRDEALDDLWPEPRLDLLDALFIPELPHSVLPDEHKGYRYSIDGVTVRYAKSSYDLQLVIEGELPDRIVEKLRSDLQSKFSLIENTTIDCISVETS